METTGAVSSLVIVPVAAAVVAVRATELLLALVMVAITVSLPSNVVSVVGSMVIVAVVEPAGMVTVPVRAEPV